MRGNKNLILILPIIIIFFINNLSSQPTYKYRRHRRRITPRIGSRPLEKNGEPLMVAVVREDAYKQARELEMWSSYYVYGEDKTHYYLGLPSSAFDVRLEEPIGWINKKYLLDNPVALRTKNKIYRRIIVFDNKFSSRVPIYYKPTRDAEERLKTPMFTFFYMYKEAKDYYLIGMSPRIDLEYPDEDLLGWIHKKSCKEWNTRLAVNYKAETKKIRIENEKKYHNGLVRIYKTLEGAISLNEKDVIAKESPKSRWTYNMPRYPLLKSKTINQKRIFNIAFLGGHKSDIIQEYIAKIKEGRERINKLDIMFLIDASLSRRTRYKLLRVIKGFKWYLRRQKARIFLDIAWGVTFYHSFRKKRKYPYKRGRAFEPKVVHIHRFTTNLSRFCRCIENEPYQGGRKKTKSLFYGIDMCMHRKARWRKGSNRCIVIIGGTGNHEPSNIRNISKLTIDDIVPALKKNRIRVYAFQILEERSDKYLKEFKLFATQMRKLIRKLNQGSYTPIYSIVGNTLRFLFNKLIGQYLYEISFLKTMVTDIERGFTLKEIKKRYQKQWKEGWDILFKKLKRFTIINNEYKGEFLMPNMISLVKGLIKSYGVNLKKLEGEGTFFNKGWVWEFNPKTNILQLQVTLLINRMEMSRLLGFLSSLLMELKRISKPEQYVEVWKTLLKTTFGIDTIPPYEPLDNLIMQHTGLPFINGLLNYTLQEFVKRARRPTFRREIIKKLDKTCNNLFLALEEKEKESIKLEDGTIIYRYKKRWWREHSNDCEYAWIEIEMFP